MPEQFNKFSNLKAMFKESYPKGKDKVKCPCKDMKNCKCDKRSMGKPVKSNLPQ